MVKNYWCGCGEWMGEACEWCGPATEMVVVQFTPEAIRETAVASGRRDTGRQQVAVCRDCWNRIHGEDGFDPDWWAETALDPASCAEEVEAVVQWECLEKAELLVDEQDEAEYAVEDCWPQVDGGVRYLVSGPNAVKITVDKDRNGRLSGFVRGKSRDNEDELLRGAWDVVQSSDD
jgi:hypothetical protein